MKVMLDIILIKLAKEGSIPPKIGRRGGRNSCLCTKIEELRNQGIGNTEIAGRLNQPVGKIRFFSSKLIRAGRIQSINPQRLT